MPFPLARLVLGFGGAAFLSLVGAAQDVGADTVIDLATPPGVAVRHDLAYDADPHQKLDLYLPSGRASQPRPVIIYVHGGGWKKGSRADGRRFAFRFVAQGYAVACIDYRLSDAAEFPAQLEDCKGAVRWLRESAGRFGLDQDHIGMVGVSAGGHLAALVGAMNSNRLYESSNSLNQHSRIQAVVDFFGPIDLLALYDEFKKPGAPLADEIAQLIGGNPHGFPVTTNASNPTAFADAQSPPFLIIHGDRDTVVPLAQSRAFYDALVRNYVIAHLHVIHGAGHTGPAFVAPDINAMVDQFLAATLKCGDDPPRLQPAVFTESDAPKP